MTMAIIPLRLLDPSIPWPEKAETELTPRRWWTPGRVKLSTSKPEPVEVDAMCYGEFAVHRMVEDEGFAITTRANGMRLYSKGRVFARSNDAMAMAELLTVLYSNWTAFLNGERDTPPQVKQIFQDEHDAAERRGEMLKDVVFPA